MTLSNAQLTAQLHQAARQAFQLQSKTIHAHLTGSTTRVTGIVLQLENGQTFTARLARPLRRHQHDKPLRRRRREVT